MQMRESKLRKAGISGRARMASEMRDLDEDVSSLSRTLAVRTLQLEMEYIYNCLEDEALDVAQDLQGAGYLLLRYTLNARTRDTPYSGMHLMLKHKFVCKSPCGR